jgi:hypothetical protein
MYLANKHKSPAAIAKAKEEMRRALEGNLNDYRIGITLEILYYALGWDEPIIDEEEAAKKELNDKISRLEKELAEIKEKEQQRIEELQREERQRMDALKRREEALQREERQRMDVLKRREEELQREERQRMDALKRREEALQREERQRMDTLKRREEALQREERQRMDTLKRREELQREEQQRIDALKRREEALQREEEELKRKQALERKAAKPAPQPPTVQIAKSENDYGKDNFKKFLAKYIALCQSDMDSNWRLQMESLRNDYYIKTFQYMSSADRYQTINQGEFWAIETSKAALYYVVPCPSLKSDRQKYFAKGMEKAFDSIYLHVYYRNMKDVEPATFRLNGTTWTLEQKGKLTFGNITDNPQPSTAQIAKHAPQPTTVQQNNDSKIAAFLSEYNALQSSKQDKNLEIRQNQFRAKYALKSFKCVNYNERLITPSLIPKYEDEFAGSFWAVSLDRQYSRFYVVPALNIWYTHGRHNAGGMKEAFDSNYQDGKIYDNIRVIEPAIFRQSGTEWTLEKKGELELREKARKPQPPTFLSEYNALQSSKQEENWKERQEQFRAKYALKSFKCVNYNERLITPSLIPKYEAVFGR